MAGALPSPACFWREQAERVVAGEAGAGGVGGGESAAEEVGLRCAGGAEAGEGPISGLATKYEAKGCEAKGCVTKGCETVEFAFSDTRSKSARKKRAAKNRIQGAQTP